MKAVQRTSCLVLARMRAVVRRCAVTRALVVAALLCVSPALSYAQCVMCGKNAEFAGGGQGRAYATLATAALVLLVPMLSFVSGLAIYVWKHRH